MALRGLDLKRVLCPTDYSDLSIEALRYGRHFATACGAELHILHVVDEAYQHWMAIGPEGMPVGPAPEELLKVGREQMDRFIREQVGEAGCAVTNSVVFGRPHVEIVNYATDTQTDMIVIATHGRGGLTRALLGSTTDKVVHNAPCPVLVVRQRQHHFVPPQGTAT